MSHLPQQGCCPGYIFWGRARRVLRIDRNERSSIIAGDIALTSGQIQVAGHSVYDSLASIRNSIGVVPQFDCIVVGLTVRRQLRLFARLRGVRKGPRCELVDQQTWIARSPEQIGEEAFGAKSLSLTLGNPPVLLIDEVSTGMDAAAKRFTRSILAALQPTKAIILTSGCRVQPRGNHGRRQTESAGQPAAAHGKIRRWVPARGERREQRGGEVAGAVWGTREVRGACRRRT
ncbi:LOW QUALITY PROTEIN: hypothetical protein BC938DRAFT_479250 [Jimgerdemannia flammicorona]|uniref:ABC transporter domain-containing protein n=1 Tax=Jimgerdemannia flammicorona TaxID=994334 RepID=A0A433QXY2_9FUNG|nr:LOW QUALITY PROTEIN: hypothetical protein BC938DRAFT_479250 [Jimgerdemannia flammicorona]